MMPRTKPTGIHATFQTECAKCQGVLTVTRGQIDPHTCDFRAVNLEAVREQINNPLTLADLESALDNR